MITLAIDTSTTRGSVALADREIAFERGELFSALAVVAANPVRGGPRAELPRAGSRLQFDQIVVGVGPGSFTGIRAGIAAAKGLAMPGRVPVLPACSFDAIALRALPGMARDCPQMCVLADGRREEVYFAMYDRQGRRTGDCRLGSLEAIELHNPVWFVSAEIERYRDILRETFGGFASVCEQPVFPNAALLRPENLPLEPIYLREPEYRKVTG
jgi:tRNA threonylcarbamoyl adenosine modification protein YeaZ